MTDPSLSESIKSVSETIQASHYQIVSESIRVIQYPSLSESTSIRVIQCLGLSESVNIRVCPNPSVRLEDAACLRTPHACTRKRAHARTRAHQPLHPSRSRLPASPWPPHQAGPVCHAGSLGRRSPPARCTGRRPDAPRAATSSCPPRRPRPRDPADAEGRSLSPRRSPGVPACRASAGPYPSPGPSPCTSAYPSPYLSSYPSPYPSPYPGPAT